MPQRSRTTYGLAAAYALALALIGLWPRHVDQGIDVVHSAPVVWLTRALSLQPYEAYDVVEVLANVVLFVPLGLLLMLLWPSLRWIQVVLVAALLSGAIELAQAVLRPDRTASLVDVVANTSGAALGAAAVVVGRRLRRR